MSTVDPIVWAILVVCLFVVASTTAMTVFLLVLLVRERVNVAKLQEQINDLTEAVNGERRNREELELQFGLFREKYNSLLDLFQRMTGAPSASPDSVIAGLPFLQDERFRGWLREHFDAPGLILLAADVGLTEPVAASPDVMAGALIAEARRVNAFRMLAQKAFERRPGVPRP